MAASDPSTALQVGIYAILTADPTLMALITGVFDEPGENDSYDYVTIGSLYGTPAGIHGREGRETVFTIHTWTEADSPLPGNAIGARLVELLWHRHAELDAQVAGHTVERVEHEYTQNMVDPDEPGIRHRIDRFRIRSVQD